MSELQKIRIDKWLWAVRLFKTRTLAKETCDSRKVKIEGVSVKAAYLLKPGQVIHFSNQGNKKVVRVLLLLEKRAGADIAQTCYEDQTPPELTEKGNPAFFYHFEVRDKGIGRPTKRQRRDIDRFKGGEDD
jgi:ribosome-associated heat shock protein Hsp15